MKTDVVLDEDDEDEDGKTEIVDTEAESVPESHEAITPQPSLTFSSRASSPLARISVDTTPVSAAAATRSTRKCSTTETKSRKPASKDNETMNAAWALCGLQNAARN